MRGILSIEFFKLPEKETLKTNLVFLQYSIQAHRTQGMTSLD